MIKKYCFTEPELIVLICDVILKHLENTDKNIKNIIKEELNKR